MIQIRKFYKIFPSLGNKTSRDYWLMLIYKLNRTEMIGYISEYWHDLRDYADKQIKNGAWDIAS